jgi:hypothetical protein
MSPKPLVYWRRAGNFCRPVWSDRNKIGKNRWQLMYVPALNSLPRLKVLPKSAVEKAALHE